MSDDSLIAAMPDFVAFMRRDGVVQRHLGGRQLGTLLRGEPLADFVPSMLAAKTSSRPRTKSSPRSLRARTTPLAMAMRSILLTTRPTPACDACSEMRRPSATST